MTQSASSPKYTPALGRRSLTGFYDAAIALFTREGLWRTALVAQLAPRDGETIVDVGCGTGALAIRIKSAAPGAALAGVDPDPEVLARARTKAHGQDLDIRFQQGFAGEIADLFGPATADKIVSSLVFHQVPIAEKRAGLASIYAALRPRGELHIADYGRQRTPLMRTMFRLVQALDGVENTRLSAAGGLPDLISEAGFREVEERGVIPTPTGSISLYRAVKPAGAAAGDDPALGTTNVPGVPQPSPADAKSGRNPWPARATGLAVVAIAVALDQITKAWAKAVLAAPIELAPMLNLRLGFNPGVTFGLLAADGAMGRWMLVALTGTVAGAMLVGMWRTRRLSMAMALASIAGGAIGNIIDRVRQGAVTDFIDLHLGERHWPTFNLADVAVVCGVAALLWMIHRPERQDEHG